MKFGYHNYFQHTNDDKYSHFYETKNIDEMWGKDYGNENLTLRKTIKLSEVPFMPLYENFMSLHACSNVWE